MSIDPCKCSIILSRFTELERSINTITGVPSKSRKKKTKGPPRPRKEGTWMHFMWDVCNKDPKHQKLSQKARMVKCGQEWKVEKVKIGFQIVGPG